MAIKDNQGFFRGTIGEYVFKVVDGKQVVQSRPFDVKQSKRTKESSSLFGMCSKQAVSVRGSLKTYLLGNQDPKMAARFLGVCFRILKANKGRSKENFDLINTDLTELKGFNFNIKSPFSSYFTPTIQIEGSPKEGLKVTIPSLIPELDIQYPDRCFTVELRIILTHTSFDCRYIGVTTHRDFLLRKNKQQLDAQIFDFEPIEEPGVTMVTAQLIFYNETSKFGKILLNNKDFHPTEVVYAK